MSLLLSPYTIRNMTMNNRVMMSPMGMVSAQEDGKVNDWHMLHYGARALGQVGLIMLEVSAVDKYGKDYGSLGIWEDEHIEGMQRLVSLLQAQGSKVGIQLWHAGRKSDIPGHAVSASGLPHGDQDSRALTIAEIQQTIQHFREAAIRAVKAGFDVIELHAAHGYLLNDFLSSYTNRRTDAYGGTVDKRYRLLSEVIAAVRDVWEGPLFVRVSADEYGEEGNRIEHTVQYTNRMKEQGVDLIDVSSGGVYPDKPNVYPGYQVPYAEAIRRQSDIATAAVGLITTGTEAEAILNKGQADVIAIGRALLRDPFWVRTAALQLHESIPAPQPYQAAW
ncbi:NADPH dehydrogenase NamA [Paenibacillus sp. WLX1005]|uniref:NADPH dehydrogenase NamA n=1 Tax=Paenibacillus sp. WLX1005 TaxID=3243766 RepID=UPI0039845F49